MLCFFSVCACAPGQQSRTRQHGKSLQWKDVFNQTAVVHKHTRWGAGCHWKWGQQVWCHWNSQIVLQLLLWLLCGILSLSLCFPHQGSLSLWGQLWDGAVLRDPQRLIYRCWGHGQVNWCGQTSKFLVGIYQWWRVHVLFQIKTWDKNSPAT